MAQREITWGEVMEIEDALQEAKVFLNPFTGLTCHSDSYGTVVQFDVLERMDWGQFDPEALQYALGYWETNPNVGPTLKIVGSFIRRKIQ